MLAVALFFFSCEDETSLLGFKNPTSQFDVRYIEFDIDTRQLLDTSVRTSNLYIASESNRFLVGTYVDPDFGTITSGAYTQFLTSSFGKLDTTAVFDSVSIRLNFDEHQYSLYNAEKKYNDTKQRINIYVLKDSLNERRETSYHARTPVNYDADSLLGTKEFWIGSKTFEFYDDTVYYTTVRLDSAWGRKIFASAEKYRDATRGTKDKDRWRDSAFVYYPNEFHKLFKGIAIVPASGDAIYGINGGTSRLILHYHTMKKDAGGNMVLKENLELPLGFSDASYMVSYNKISADWSGTELETLQPNISADLNRRYIQSGIGLTPEIDFAKVLEFADTIPNILIQSASLTIEDVNGNSYALPTSLTLRALNVENVRTKFYGSYQDNVNLKVYNSFIYPDVNPASVLVDLDSSIYVRNDVNTGTVLQYDEKTNRYTGSIGGFLQQIIKNYNARTPYLRFSIYPTSTVALKSVTRAVFDKEKVKLRIYYVKPTVNTK